jgi:hypothetical protein
MVVRLVVLDKAPVQMFIKRTAKVVISSSVSKIAHNLVIQDAGQTDDDKTMPSYQSGTTSDSNFHVFTALRHYLKCIATLKFCIGYA